jgi:hypothetical protein
MAEKHDFDAIPILRKGEIKDYWSRSAGRILPITRRHRVTHDTCVEQVLQRLNEHVIQFVYYRSEVVGLVDLSDLNKPLARLTWLQPILECEQAIFMKTLLCRFSESEVAKALGDAAKGARTRRQRAKKEDLDTPLLGFAQFSDVLNAGVVLKVVHLSSEEIQRLNELRKRLVHGVRSLVEKRSDGEELQWALHVCRSILRTVQLS